jgi:DNA-3-methyladenine glycosylase I
MPNVARCRWASSELSIPYHDTEWGVPLHDDQRLFEFLILEGAQAGLSWETILRKRDHYRAVFDDFDPERVARYTPKKVEKLLADPGIVRNRLKVESTVNNAQRILELDVPLSELLWSFVGGEPKLNRWKTTREIPAETVESKTMSKELKRRGFRFVGPTVCYAFMQAAGLVNDHTAECFLSPPR